MGAAILSQALQQQRQQQAAGSSSVIAGLSGLPDAHLANLTPSDLAHNLSASLPESLTGQQFLSQYGPHVDSVTSVDPSRAYAVRAPTVHPVNEHARVRLFRQLLAGPQSCEQLALLGELMLQSHESYNACALGSGGTDRYVQDH